MEIRWTFRKPKVSGRPERVEQVETRDPTVGRWFRLERVGGMAQPVELMVTADEIRRRPLKEEDVIEVGLHVIEREILRDFRGE